MAYDYDGIDDNWDLGSALTTTLPISVALLFWADIDTDDMTIFEIGNSAASSNYIARVQLRGSSALNEIRAISANTAARIAGTSTGFTANAWQHALAVFAAADDRRIYLNGGGKGTNATSVSPTGQDGTRLGDRPATTTQPHNGRLAELCVWNVALSDGEAALLGAGPPWLCPRLIRPEAIIHYRSMIRDVNHPYLGAGTWTVNQAVVIEHPPVIYQMPAIVVPKFTPAGGGGAEGAAWHQYAQMMGAA